MRRHSGDVGVSLGGSQSARRCGVGMEHLMVGSREARKGRAERGADAPLRRAVLGANDR